MFDDDDSKIRRNLVLASASVLLSAYLEISFRQFLIAALPKGIVVDEVRLMVAGLATFIYLGMRYSFLSNAQGTRYTHIFEDAVSAEKLKMLGLLANVQFKIFRKTGLIPALFRTTFSEYLARNGPNHRTETAGVYAARPKLQLGYTRVDNGNIIFSVALDWSRSSKFVHSGGTLQCDPRWQDRVIVAMLARAQIYVYSATGIQYCIPALLGLLATCVLTWKVIADVTSR